MTKAVTKKENTEVSTDVIDLSQYQGMGAEDATMDDMSIPFLVIIQKNSPQVDPDNPKFLKDAKAGDIMNTMTGEIFSRANGGVKLYHCGFKKNVVEWVPRDQGGGIRGVHELDSETYLNAKPHPQKRFLRVTEDGNDLIDTRYHYVMYEGSEGLEPAVISMTSTMVKMSKRWMSLLKTSKVKLPDGRVIGAPTWLYPYQASVLAQTKDTNTWLIWQMDKIEGESCKDDPDTFKACYDFHEAVKAGETKLSDMDQTMDHEARSSNAAQNNATSGDIPF